MLYVYKKIRAFGEVMDTNIVRENQNVFYRDCLSLQKNIPNANFDILIFEKKLQKSRSISEDCLPNDWVVNI